MSLVLISCAKHMAIERITIFTPMLLVTRSYTQVFIKFPVSLNFSLKIDSNPQPMSYFRPQEEVGCETSMAIEFIKLCNPISLVTCSRRDKCLFNFQHHWNAVHRVRPRSSELCNWMPYSVGLLHIVCTPYIYIYIHTYI